MRKLHEKRKRPLTWRLAWKREQAETPQKKYARICLSDLFGQTHTDILLRLRRCRQPFVAHSWVASGWLYLSLFRFQQKRKIKREQTESVNQSKPHKRSVSVYAYPTCSDRHIRTFFSSFGGTDSLLWLTCERQVAGCNYYNSAFNKVKKRQREQTESVKSRSPTKEVYPYMPIRLARTDTYGHSSPASAVRTTFCGSPVSGKWLAVPISVPLSTRNKRHKW